MSVVPAGSVIPRQTERVDVAFDAWASAKRSATGCRVFSRYSGSVALGLIHGSNVKLRKQIEPLLTTYRVNAVFSGHNHIYERTKPQQGIQYFVTGAGGKTRRGGVDLRSPIREVSFDEDNHFMLVEVTHQQMSFRAISEVGRVIDQGIINPT